MRRAAIVLAMLLAASCGERARTQVMLIVEADAAVRAAATSVTVSVDGSAPGGAFEAAGTTTFDPRETGWPIEVAIVPRGEDASRRWRAEVVAGGGVRVEARAIGGFVAERTLAHTIRLSLACNETSCGEQETCVDGRCASAVVPADALQPYAPPGRTDAGAPEDAGAEDAGTSDAGPPDAGSDAGPGCLPSTDRVDLLLVVDNSNSMAEEQVSLAAELPYLVRVLTTGDIDGDSLPDFEPIEDLQVGVVTSDMGTGGIVVPTCPMSDRGDDGVVRTTGNTTISGCSAAYPSVLQFGLGDDPDSFAFDVACVARVGTTGCGFEQQLEAMLKAIAPQTPTSWTAPDYTPIVFYGDRWGHGDGENAGLFRDDSVLAVVVLTDEEDCSWTNPELVNPSSTVYTEDLNLRCFSHPEVLHPVARYTEGLLQMRADPRRLVFAAITGIPLDADPGDAPASYTSILANPAMEERVDTTTPPGRLVPSCDVPERGVAFPPRRIVQVAQGLGATPGVGHTVHSICQASYRVATTRIARLIGARVAGTCDP